MAPVSLALILLFLATTLSAGQVTTCGQLVRAGEVADLVADLVCTSPTASGTAPVGIYLDGDATLNLNGFSIKGGGSGVGVLCSAQTRRGSSNPRYVIRGPGEISGFWSGLNGGGRKAKLSDVTLTGNTAGLDLPLVARLDLTGVVASQNAEFGIVGQEIRGDVVEAADNALGGVLALRRSRLRRLTATGNGSEGGFQGSGRIAKSTVTGNDGLQQGYDILSPGRMRLANTICGKGATIEVSRTEAGRTITVVGTLDCTGD